MAEGSGGECARSSDAAAAARAGFAEVCVCICACERASKRECELVSERECERARARVVCDVLALPFAGQQPGSHARTAHARCIWLYDELVRTGVRTFLTVTSRPVEQTHTHARTHTHTHEHTADTSVGGGVKIHGHRGCVCRETPMRARMGACGFLFTAAVPCPGDTVYVCVYVCVSMRFCGRVSAVAVPCARARVHFGV
jgi:hypothetical protein